MVVAQPGASGHPRTECWLTAANLVPVEHGDLDSPALQHRALALYLLEVTVVAADQECAGGVQTHTQPRGVRGPHGEAA